jgi:uncharacterized protein YdhG (YjbR/CyaY superfamily)
MVATLEVMMDKGKVAPGNIDDYIAGFPSAIQEILQQVRATIRAAAPGAQEKISYQMPAFTLHDKTLVYFAGHSEHIGFYPEPDGIEAFKQELARYKGGKGSVQFPLGEPMPYDLITRIVEYKVKTVTTKTQATAVKAR